MGKQMPGYAVAIGNRQVKRCTSNIEDYRAFSYCSIRVD